MGKGEGEEAIVLLLRVYPERYPGVYAWIKGLRERRRNGGSISINDAVISRLEATLGAGTETDTSPLPPALDEEVLRRTLRDVLLEVLDGRDLASMPQDEDEESALLLDELGALSEF